MAFTGAPSESPPWPFCPFARGCRAFVQVMKAIEGRSDGSRRRVRSDLERFRLSEVLDARGFEKGKENTSLIFLSEYCGLFFISYKYSSIVSSKCKMRH